MHSQRHPRLAPATLTRRMRSSPSCPRSSIGWRGGAASATVASTASASRRSCTRPTCRCRAERASRSSITARFMAYAARVMRGLIIDDVRRRRSQKRGGLFEITSLAPTTRERVTDAARAGADQRRARRARRGRAGARRNRRPEVLLRLLVRRDRRHARRVGTDDPAQLGEGPPLPAPRDRRRESDGDETLMPPISPDRWRALSPYLDEALDIAADERARLARRRSAARDAALAADLPAILLAARARSASRASSKAPCLRSARGADRRRSPARSLGAYRLVSPIGQGGMGSVWLAERCDGRFEGRAAVKLLNIALIGPRRRRAVPARRQHPRAADAIRTSRI